MHTNIIKNTVMLDKKAREEVKALEKEKEFLDEWIKQDEERIKIENKTIIQNTSEEVKNSYEEKLRVLEVKEVEQYQKTLKALKEKFKDNEENWIKEIYDFCIK